MSYTYEIKETLTEFSGALYRVIELKLVNVEGKFTHFSLPIEVKVSDGTLEVQSFKTTISGNQKELIACFTVDAFTGFSSSSSIAYGYGGEFEEVVTGVDVTSVPSLPLYYASTPYTDATNAWLATL
jgi:hypothetical protein